MAREEIVSKGERTRQAIVNAAYNLIIKQGYAATSMREIADRADMAAGSIYNHFASKEDVFEAVIMERHPIVQIIPILGSVPGHTVEEFVHNAAHALIEQLGRHPEFVNLMLTEIVEFRGAHMPLVFEKMLPTMYGIADRFSHLEGNLRPIPPLVMLRTFAGAFLFYYVTEALLGPRMPPEMRVNSLDHFVEIILHGILMEEKK